MSKAKQGFCSYFTAVGALKKRGITELYNVFSGERRPIAYWLACPPIADARHTDCRPHLGSGIYCNGNMILSVDDPRKRKI